MRREQQTKIRRSSSEVLEVQDESALPRLLMRSAQFMMTSPEFTKRLLHKVCMNAFKVQNECTDDSGQHINLHHSFITAALPLMT